jgi:hypothetical protein
MAQYQDPTQPPPPPIPGVNTQEADYTGLPHGNVGDITGRLGKLAYEQQRAAVDDAVMVAQEQWQYMGIGWRCPERHSYLETQQQQMALACAHIIHQDEIHPAGMVYLPLAIYKDRGFYICRECLRLLERKKFNFWNELRFTCWYCILEEAQRLRQLNPELVCDFRERKL